MGNKVIFLVIGAIISVLFGFFSGTIYEAIYFAEGFSDTMFQLDIYKIVGIITILVPWAIAAIYYYVINSVSSVKRPDGNGNRVRNVIINSVDIMRPNGKTWLDSIDTMEIPYIGKDHPLYDHDYLESDPEAEEKHDGIQS